MHHGLDPDDLRSTVGVNPWVYLMLMEKRRSYQNDLAERERIAAAATPEFRNRTTQPDFSVKVDLSEPSPDRCAGRNSIRPWIRARIRPFGLAAVTRIR